MLKINEVAAGLITALKATVVLAGMGKALEVKVIEAQATE